MTYKIVYCQEPNRVIPSVLIDARASIPEIANQIGVTIKAYTDAKVALVTATVISYRIETEEGNLAGFFSLQVILGSKTASIQQFVLRPAFEQFLATISGLINTFITNNQWQADYLF